MRTKLIDKIKMTGCAAGAFIAKLTGDDAAMLQNIKTMPQTRLTAKTDAT